MTLLYPLPGRTDANDICVPDTFLEGCFYFFSRLKHATSGQASPIVHFQTIWESKIRRSTSLLCMHDTDYCRQFCLVAVAANDLGVATKSICNLLQKVEDGTSTGEMFHFRRVLSFFCSFFSSSVGRSRVGTLFNFTNACHCTCAVQALCLWEHGSGGLVWDYGNGKDSDQLVTDISTTLSCTTSEKCIIHEGREVQGVH